VGEVSNWTGKAFAAPRTELDDLLSREETESSGVYLLLGVNPDTGDNLAYIGEAEVIRDRLKQHRAGAAAAVIHGGSANGLTAWRDTSGKSLKELEDA
jgi:hypothetical protein